MAKYRILDAMGCLNRNGTLHAPGAVLELPKAEAESYLARGFVELVPEPKAPKESKPPPKEAPK